MPNVDPAILSTMPLFHNLTLTEVAWLTTHLGRTTFPSGTIIMAVEGPAEVAYLIIRGTVKIHIEQADGRDVLLAIRGVGERIGESGVITGSQRTATVTTLEETLVYWLDAAVLREALHTIPTLSINLIRILARRLRLADAQIQLLTTQDVLGRVARQLLAFAEEYGEPVAGNAIHIPLYLTQSDLASLVGASRVHANRALSFFRQRGAISMDRQHRITIHHPAVLAQRCQ